MVRVEPTCHPCVNECRVVVDGCLVFEENIPDVGVVLNSVIRCRCLVVVITIVIADAGQDGRVREILLDGLGDSGHGREHHWPVRVWN